MCGSLREVGMGIAFFKGNSIRYADATVVLLL
jgi:hypothetical protein